MTLRCRTQVSGDWQNLKYFTEMSLGKKISMFASMGDLSRYYYDEAFMIHGAASLVDEVDDGAQ